MIFGDGQPSKGFSKETQRSSESLNHFLSSSDSYGESFSASPTSELWSRDNFRIIIDIDQILRQEIDLLIVFYKWKHATHTKYFTVLCLQYHLRYQKIFIKAFESKIRFHIFVVLDLDNILGTHNMDISLEMKARKKRN